MMPELATMVNLDATAIRKFALVAGDASQRDIMLI